MESRKSHTVVSQTINVKDVPGLKLNNEPLSEKIDISHMKPFCSDAGNFEKYFGVKGGRRSVIINS